LIHLFKFFYLIFLSDWNNPNAALLKRRSLSTSTIIFLVLLAILFALILIYMLVSSLRRHTANARQAKTDIDGGEAAGKGADKPLITNKK
jgi:hypothetical protein